MGRSTYKLARCKTPKYLFSNTLLQTLCSCKEDDGWYYKIIFRWSRIGIFIFVVVLVIGVFFFLIVIVVYCYRYRFSRPSRRIHIPTFVVFIISIYYHSSSLLIVAVFLLSFLTAPHSYFSCFYWILFIIILINWRRIIIPALLPFHVVRV